MFFFYFSYEFVDSASPGFVLPPSEAPGVCHETYVGMKAFLAAIKQELQSNMSG